MLEPTSTFKRKIECGVLPFRKKRLRRRKMEDNLNLATVFNLDVNEYAKAVAMYFTDNEQTCNMIKDLVLVAKQIFEETYETSGSSLDSNASFFGDVDIMATNIRILTDKINIGNGDLVLNEEERKTLVAVVNEIIRSKYYVQTTKLRVIAELVKMDQLFQMHLFC
ncbi:hypothetical protein U1Q18_042285 [Sarracenia purpurea var. burkii]